MTGLSPPAGGEFYRDQVARPAPGADTLAWEVKYQNKTLGIRRYSATVNVAPAP